MQPSSCLPGQQRHCKLSSSSKSSSRQQAAAVARVRQRPPLLLCPGHTQQQQQVICRQQSAAVAQDDPGEGEAMGECLLTVHVLPTQESSLVVADCCASSFATEQQSAAGFSLLCWLLLPATAKIGSSSTPLALFPAPWLTLQLITARIPHICALVSCELMCFPLCCPLLVWCWLQPL